MKYLLIFLIASASTLSGQSIIGEWVTYDDNTKEKKSVVEIYAHNGVYEGKIVETFIEDKDAICNTCKGSKKGKPLIGLVIIEDLKNYEDEYGGGTIMDPESGDTYKCSLELIDNNKLKMRGYLGISLFGRTQYWIRK